MDDIYTIVEDAVLALVKEKLDNVDDYFTDPTVQVSKSDDTVLSKGFEYFFITYPSTFTPTDGGTGVVDTQWVLGVEMFVRFSNTADTWSRFKRFRSDLFNLFNVKTVGKTLNRTPGVRNSLLVGDNEPVPYGEEGGEGDPVFFAQKMTLNVSSKSNRE